jgi:proteasome lid subunit RPN8/RPN11
MSDAILIRRKYIKQIQAKIINGRKTEVCGFLLGIRRLNEIWIEACVLVKNVSGHNSFWITDEERSQVEDFARLESLEIMAVFHSHPSGAIELSETDRRLAKVSKLYWIVCGAPDEMSGNVVLHAYAPGTLTPVAVVTID